MRFYIGYKFTNVADKDGLKAKVIKIADFINTKGYATFVLGRDVQNWHSSPFPMIKTLPHVFINMLRADHLISVISDESKSTGLLVENILAMILLKKRCFIVKTGINKNIYNFLTDPNNVVWYSSEENMETAIEELLNSRC